MKDIDIFQEILGKNYDVCYEVERGCGERWANGELITYTIMTDKLFIIFRIKELNGYYQVRNLHH